jgi:hypothetical protein
MFKGDKDQRPKMRFHCLMILRDEGDIIEQSLDHLLSWADAVYVLDLGSTDNTWDSVQARASKDKRVVPFKSAPLVFNDNLRGYIFNQFRDRFEHGDWILRTDTDEIYHVPPPQFVTDRLARLDTAVWLQWYYFRLTQREVADYESGNVDILEDRKRPISDRRRYYKVSQYGEPRMFRYRRDMKWNHAASFPTNAGFISRQRVPIRHYPHRDPLQMQTRFLLRARMMMLKANAGSHWKVQDWRAEVVDDLGMSAAALGKQKHGLAGEDGIDTGPMLYWEPGTELPDPRLLHAVPFPKRLMQRIIHPALLPILDRRPGGWEPSFQPEALPPHMRGSLIP